MENPICISTIQKQTIWLNIIVINNSEMPTLGLYIIFFITFINV